MQCDICFRPHGKELPFLCAVDVRNHLYPVRLEIARVLLEKDAISKDVDAETLQPGTSDDKSLSNGTSVRSILDHNLAEKEAVEDRTLQIIAHADELREKIKQVRATRAAQKASVQRRKFELASAKNGFERPWQARIEEADKSTKRTKFKWNKQNDTIADARTYLCCEAAKLYGLRKVTIKRNGSWLEEYKIGGVNIMDLREMNSRSCISCGIDKYLPNLDNTGLTPTHITTVLSHIAHILVLSTHYLALRLPAEITLPHRDYPLPTIFPIGTSYKTSNVPFPGSTPAHSSNNSPTASRHGDITPQHRPRPLFLDRPLPLLAKEDPSTYTAFLEGVTLLAYNIAWVCKSQGIPVGENNTFEEVCAIGTNFFNLLIGTSPRPVPAQIPSSQAPSSKGSEVETKPEDNQRLTMGRFSHGTSHTFLGGAEGQEFIRSWKLLSPIKVADRLKAQLLGEMTGAEWEILDQKAWEVEEGEEEGAVSLAPKEESLDAAALIGENVTDEERKPGTSGWTKVKPR